MLPDWMLTQSFWGQLSAVKKCSKLIASKDIHSEVAKRISLWEVRDAIPEYKKNMTAGKYLIYPHQEKNNSQGDKGALIVPGSQEEKKEEEKQI